MVTDHDWRGPFARRELTRLASGRLFAFVGAGLSRGAGLVSWAEMAEAIHAFRRQYEGCSPEPFPVDATGYEDVVGKFVGLAQQERGCHATLGRLAFLNMLLRRRKPRVRWRDFGVELESGGPGRWGQEPAVEDLLPHALVWKTRCQGVFTTNYDCLLETAYAVYGYGTALRTYRPDASFLELLLTNPRFVLKVHGDINDAAGMIVRPFGTWGIGESGEDGEGEDGESGKDGKDAGSLDDVVEAYGTALNLGHMVYLGCGFQDRGFLRFHRRALAVEHGRAPHRSPIRLAFVPRGEVPAIVHALGDADPDLLLLTYGEEAPGAALRMLLEEIVGLRSEVVPEPVSVEADDIHKRFFVDPPRTARGRRMSTRPWTGFPTEAEGE
jgi:SIR2-like protein